MKVKKSICKEKFCYDKNKKSEYALYHKVRDHCHYTGKFRGVAHNIFNLRYKVPKKNLIVFHNGSRYDYHFITKQLAEDFKGQFECLGVKTEKYITFSVPIKNVAKLLMMIIVKKENNHIQTKVY